MKKQFNAAGSCFVFAALLGLITLITITWNLFSGLQEFRYSIFIFGLSSFIFLVLGLIFFNNSAIAMDALETGKRYTLIEHFPEIKATALMFYNEKNKKEVGIFFDVIFESPDIIRNVAYLAEKGTDKKLHLTKI